MSYKFPHPIVRPAHLGTPQGPRVGTQSKSAAAIGDARIPDVPHVREIIVAMPENEWQPIMVAAFLDNATIEHPALGYEVTSRWWLANRLWRSPAQVIEFAN